MPQEFELEYIVFLFLSYLSFLEPRVLVFETLVCTSIYILIQIGMAYTMYLKEHVFEGTGIRMPHVFEYNVYSNEHVI